MEEALALGLPSAAMRRAAALAATRRALVGFSTLPLPHLVRVRMIGVVAQCLQCRHGSAHRSGALDALAVVTWVALTLLAAAVGYVHVAGGGALASSVSSAWLLPVACVVALAAEALAVGVGSLAAVGGRAAWAARHPQLAPGMAHIHDGAAAAAASASAASDAGISAGDGAPSAQPPLAPTKPPAAPPLLPPLFWLSVLALTCALALSLYLVAGFGLLRGDGASGIVLGICALALALHAVAVAPVGVCARVAWARRGRGERGKKRAAGGWQRVLCCRAHAARVAPAAAGGGEAAAEAEGSAAADAELLVLLYASAQAVAAAAAAGRGRGKGGNMEAAWRAALAANAPLCLLAVGELTKAQ